MMNKVAVRGIGLSVDFQDAVMKKGGKRATLIL